MIDKHKQLETVTAERSLQAQKGAVNVATKPNLYQEITDQIIRELEQGTVPWVKPWVVQLPYNAVSQRPYSGVNVLLLWDASNRRQYKHSTWLTYKQAQALGGHVKKGEHGVTIVYTDSYVKKAETKKTSDTQEDDAARIVKFLKSYTVFNIEQTEGLPAHLYQLPKVSEFADRRSDVEAFIQGLGADIRHGGHKAAYNRARDLIKLPHPETFKDAQGYYLTSLHEHGHWTGHDNRLNRQFGQRFGDKAYAFEELVAELTCAFVAARLQIETRLQHAGYIEHWLEILKADKQAIFTAASRATEAAEYLFQVGRADELPAEADTVE
jgi:antirestriction protein ArdC